MLHRDGDFEEWQLAEVARRYIPLYQKGEVAYVPYIDDPTGEKKFVKYVLVDGIWLYVDNSQEG